MNSEVKPGYKLTEAGMVPEGWEFVSLGDMIKLQRGFDLPHRLRCDGDIPIVSSAGITATHNRAQAEGPGVVTGRYGTIGEVFFVESEYWPLNTTLYVKDFKGNFQRFIYYLLKTIDFKSHSGKSGVPGVNRNDLHELVVAKPPIFQQRAIATALSDIDTLISGLDQLIVKKSDIKQAAMQQLLTGQQRLPGFSGEWEVKRLGEIGIFLKGSGVRRDQSLSGDLPCIRYGEIYTEHNDYIREFKSFISAPVSKDATRIECGDIMFAGSGETKKDIGKCVSFIDNIEAYAGGDIVILRPKNVNSLFLGYALNTPIVSHQKASRGQGDAVVHISANALATIEVLMPNKAEQSAIAKVLADMDNELANLETHRNKIRKLKLGAMQQLLSGKIRLIY